MTIWRIVLVTEPARSFRDHGEVSEIGTVREGRTIGQWLCSRALRHPSASLAPGSELALLARAGYEVTSCNRPAFFLNSS